MGKKTYSINKPDTEVTVTDASELVVPEVKEEPKFASVFPEFAELEKVTHPADYVALRVYVTLSGHKWDQMAGFVSHARHNNLGPLTIEAWNNEYKKFQSKPIG